MAGMLPGVESARRRRLHHGGSFDPASRSWRLGYGLHATSSETGISSNIMQRRRMEQGFNGGALGNIAREAKERLDERLRSQLSKVKRHNIAMNMTATESADGGNLQREELYCKKYWRRFSWTKLSWRSSEQIECVVCLEEFKAGNILAHLPCGHQFHWSCVAPWLESSSQCPCCRMTVIA